MLPHMVSPLLYPDSFTTAYTWHIFGIPCVKSAGSLLEEAKSSMVIWILCPDCAVMIQGLSLDPHDVSSAIVLDMKPVAEGVFTWSAVLHWSSGAVATTKIDMSIINYRTLADQGLYDISK